MNLKMLLIILGLVAGAMVGGGTALLMSMWSGAPMPWSQAAEESTPSDPESPTAKMMDVDPSLVQYQQTEEFSTGLHEAYCLDCGPEDCIYVGGDKKICRLAADGAPMSEIALDGAPRCLSVAPAEHVAKGRIYVGFDEHVEVFDEQGKRQAVWNSLGPQAIVTSIAAAEGKNVFVADAGNRIVVRYDDKGAIQNRIGEPGRSHKIPGFQITSQSRYFDLAAGIDGLLYVVNPRALRVEGYTSAGDLELFWGKASTSIDGFFGCCNPAHIAVMYDGRFVTAEKGIPRIKLYSEQGKFECVVAGPKQMEVTVADLASDRRGRILALDPTTATVRVFTPKTWKKVRDSGSDDARGVNSQPEKVDRPARPASNDPLDFQHRPSNRQKTGFGGDL